MKYYWLFQRYHKEQGTANKQPVLSQQIGQPVTCTNIS